MISFHVNRLKIVINVLNHTIQYVDYAIKYLDGTLAAGLLSSIKVYGSNPCTLVLLC